MSARWVHAVATNGLERADRSWERTHRASIRPVEFWRLCKQKRRLINAFTVIVDWRAHPLSSKENQLVVSTHRVGKKLRETPGKRPAKFLLNMCMIFVVGENPKLAKKIRGKTLDITAALRKRLRIV